jgi:hypothetical protein
VSTSETTEHIIGTCPCGAGHIVQEVTTQDNPWSSADISYSVSCKECRKLWSAGRSTLTSIPDQVERDRAYAVVRDISDEIDALVADEVNDYFDNPRFKNMAQEQREMVRLNLMPRDIRNYRNGRNAGVSYADLCRPLNNPKWLRKLLEASDKVAELDRLLVDHAAAEKNYGSKQIRRITFRDDGYR